MSLRDLTGVYWVAHSIGTGEAYNQITLDLLEERLSKLLRQELLIQKKLEKDQEADVPEGLQSMSLSDLEVIEHYY